MILTLPQVFVKSPVRAPSPQVHSEHVLRMLLAGVGSPQQFPRRRPTPCDITGETEILTFCKNSLRKLHEWGGAVSPGFGI